MNHQFLGFSGTHLKVKVVRCVFLGPLTSLGAPTDFDVMPFFNGVNARGSRNQSAKTDW